MTAGDAHGSMTHWDAWYRDDPDHVEVPDQILARELADTAPGTALDLGCGRGTNALQLAAWEWQVLGVDISPHAIALARSAASARNLAVHFVVADVCTWQPRCCFDLVISTFALPAGTGGRRTLAMAAAATAPGGSLLVVEWDVSMAETWGWSEVDLYSPPCIAAQMPDLEIETAQVRDLVNLYPPGDPRRQAWTTNSARVAVVRAYRPVP